MLKTNVILLPARVTVSSTDLNCPSASYRLAGTANCQRNPCRTAQLAIAAPILTEPCRRHRRHGERFHGCQLTDLQIQDSPGDDRLAGKLAVKMQEANSTIPMLSGLHHFPTTDRSGLSSRYQGELREVIRNISPLIPARMNYSIHAKQILPLLALRNEMEIIDKNTANKLTVAFGIVML